MGPLKYFSIYQITPHKHRHSTFICFQSLFFFSAPTKRADSISVVSTGLLSREYSKILPGFINQYGSRARLTLRMTSIVSGPSSLTRYSFLPRPMPCSPCNLCQYVISFFRLLLTVQEPSISMARSTMS